MLEINKTEKIVMSKEIVLRDVEILSLLENQDNYIKFLEEKIKEQDKMLEAQELEIRELLEGTYAPF